MRSGTTARGFAAPTHLNACVPSESERSRMGEALQARAPLDRGPRILPRAPCLSQQQPGPRTAGPWSRSHRVGPSASSPARLQPLPALAADLSGGAGAAPAGLDNQEAPACRRAGCGGARWAQAPRRPGEAGAQAAIHSLLSGCRGEGDRTVE